MSVFEELRPFVSLCQACGMVPYTIENNLITNKFAGFTLSFNRLVTWWFCLVFILQLASSFEMIHFGVNMINAISTDRDVPATIGILIGWTLVSHFAQFFLSRWVVFHYRKLRNVVQTVQEIERIFEGKFVAQRKSSIMLRFVIGFILVILASTCNLFVSMPSFQPSIFPQMDIFLLSIVLSVFALVTMMFDCTFFLIHMCYYVIAHYMQLICLNSSKDVERIVFTSQKEDENIKALRKNSLVFHYLCQASSELNDIFSIPTLILLTLKFISIVSAAFIYISSFIHSNDVLENGKYFIAFVGLTDCFRMLVLLTAADLPVNQVRLLRERLIAISNSGLCQTLAEKIAAMTFLLQVDEDLVRLSAAGMFKVGVHLIPALAGAAVTYMVILLQN